MSSSWARSSSLMGRWSRPTSMSARTASRRRCSVGLERIMRAMFIAASLVAAFAATAAWAQQAVRVSGTITAVEGAVLTVKGRDGAEQKVRLKDNAAVIGVAKATLADIKPNSFIGVGAMPQ